MNYELKKILVELVCVVVKDILSIWNLHRKRRVNSTNPPFPLFINHSICSKISIIYKVEMVERWNKAWKVRKKGQNELLIMIFLIL